MMVPKAPAFGLVLHMNISILKDTHQQALLPCKADLFVRCRGPSPKERQSSAAVKHWIPAAPNWGVSSENKTKLKWKHTIFVPPTAVQHLRQPPRCSLNPVLQKSTCGKWRFVPNMHEHVAEEAPHLCTVAGVVDQGALHEVRLIGLQHPLV